MAPKATPTPPRSRPALRNQRKAASSASPKPTRPTSASPRTASSSPRSGASTPRRTGKKSPGRASSKKGAKSGDGRRPAARTKPVSRTVSGRQQVPADDPQVTKKASQIAQQFEGKVPDGFANFKGFEAGSKARSRSPQGDGGPSTPRTSRMSPMASSPSLTPRARQKEGWEELRSYLLRRFKTQRRAFRALDTNNTGLLSGGEMHEEMDNLEIPWREITGQSRMENVLKGLPGSSKNGKYSIEELFGKQNKLHAMGYDSGDDDSDGSLYHLEMGFSNVDEVIKFTLWAVVDNRWLGFDKLFHADAKFTHRGVVERREVCLRDWQETCRTLRYPGDAKVIFQEIQNECLTDRERANRKDQEVDTIFARQFRSFQRKAMALNSHLDPDRDGSPVVRLADLLKRLRGSVLRAWRTDMDIRGTGKVAYTDFARACRGLNLQTQVMQAWKCLRPSTADPIEFQDLAYNEAMNLERFAEALWNVCGFNVDEAWGLLDVDRQNFVNKKQFVAAAAQIGFDGDAQLIFHGLSSPGCSRLWKSEFAYIAKVSCTANRRLSQSTHLVHSLINWVQSTLGSSEALISKLGLTPSTPTISVSDFAARLTAMGFTGDALFVASRASRLEGGTFVSAESLHLLLTGARRTAQRPSIQRSPVVWVRPQPQQRKEAWENTVNDIGSNNDVTPRGLRKYFGSPNPTRGESFSVGSPSGGAQAQPQRSASTGNIQQSPSLMSRTTEKRKSLIGGRWKPHTEPGKPEWNGGLYPLSASNSEKSAGMKCFFDHVTDKPIRAEMLRTIEDKRVKAWQSEADRIRGAFERLANSGLTVGERVLLSIKAMLDERKLKIVPFFQSLDTDGSGELDPEELAEAMLRIGLELSESELEGLIMTVGGKEGGGSMSVRDVGRALRATEHKLKVLERHHQSRSSTL
eukprot:TRINITY_DN35064_c0_g1_i1.p1 TRINITY_DN35064_c0_g1~~TRINITY_DN35064_c0_g1_i1.p1  ORF type:complete len:918 (-),score=166.87 TRINITY_DN35064_c0_g1_i1:215-2968(-)